MPDRRSSCPTCRASRTVQRLTNEPGQDGWPAWSPGGIPRALGGIPDWTADRG